VARSKQTIARDSVFRRTGDGPAGPAAQGLGEAEPPARQTAVWLGDGEVEWLDACCQEMKRSGWRGVTRSALIRSLIRAAMVNQPDLQGVIGEEELERRFTDSRKK
jgi:hypothetical protein